MIEQKSISLQREWAKQNNLEDYVIDGPIDYKQYEKCKFKILFYFKETYGYQGCGELIIGKAFPSWIEARKKTNVREAWLAYNILDSLDSGKIKKEKEFREVFYDNNKLLEACYKIAHVNVKKTSGESISNNRIIREFSRKHSELLRKQLILYKPDLIIVGGQVCWHSLIEDLNLFSIKNTSLKKPYIIKSDNTYLCNFNHISYTGFNVYEHYKLIMKYLQKEKS